MLIVLRGVSGSGKSTTVRRLIAHADSVERTMDPWRPERVLYYALTSERERERLLVIGDYDGTSTKGAEVFVDLTNGGYGRAFVLSLCDELLGCGSTLVEGSTVADANVAWANFQRVTDHCVVYADLDTPFDRCVAQIRQRRAEAGRDPERSLDVEDLRARYRRLVRGSAAWTGERRVVPVDRAVETIISWL